MICIDELDFILNFFSDRRKGKKANIICDKIDTGVNMLRVKIEHQNFVDS